MLPFPLMLLLTCRLCVVFVLVLALDWWMMPMVLMLLSIMKLTVHCMMVSTCMCMR